MSFVEQRYHLDNVYFDLKMCPFTGKTNNGSNSSRPSMSREPTEIGGTNDSYRGANPHNIKALGTSDLKERGRLMRMNTGAHNNQIHSILYASYRKKAFNAEHLLLLLLLYKTIRALSHYFINSPFSHTYLQLL